MMIQRILALGGRLPASGPASRVRDGRRGGFTLIELLIVAAIVGILAGLAIPNLRTVLLRARATELVGDVELVRKTVLQYQADTFNWPSPAPAGVVPADLEGHLPEGYSFQRNGYQLQFVVMNLPGGLPGDPSTRRLVGVTVIVEDPLLGNAFVEILGTVIAFSTGNSHTVIIDRSS